MQCIRKSFHRALHLVTAHLHHQNKLQVAHDQALHTTDVLARNIQHALPIHFAQRMHEYPVAITLICLIYNRTLFGAAQ